MLGKVKFTSGRPFGSPGRMSHRHSPSAARDSAVGLEGSPRNSAPLRELAPPIGQALSDAVAAFERLQSLGGGGCGAFPTKEGLTLRESLEGLYAFSLHTGAIGWDLWEPSRPCTEAAVTLARARTEAYSRILRAACLGADRPSIAWLGSIHRSMKAALVADRPKHPELAKAVGVPPDARALGELDRVLGELGARHPFVGAAEVCQQLELALPYPHYGRLLSAVVLSALLSRGAHAPLLVSPLFHRIFRLRNAPLADEFARRAAVPRGPWTHFFLTLLTQSFRSAYTCELSLMTRFTGDHKCLLGCERITKLSFQLHAALLSEPVTSAASVVERLGVSKPSANRAIETLVDTGILVEVTGKLRDRHYRYERLLQGIFAVIGGDDE